MDAMKRFFVGAQDVATFVCLLRGINISGQKLMKMKELQAALDERGLEDVRTYIQSGNVVFRAKGKRADKLRDVVRDAINTRWGFDVPTLVISAEDLRAIAAANPYASDTDKDPARTFVMFFVEPPDAAKVRELPPSPGGAVEFIVGARAIYAHYPNGYGTTKMDNNFFERKLGVAMTARNVRTVKVLLEMVAD